MINTWRGRSYLAAGGQYMTAITFMSKTLAFTISIIFLQMSFPCAQSLTPAQVRNGKLKGVIVDWQYGRVLGSCLTVKNRTFEKKVVVDMNGAFEVELPVGTYDVTAQSPGFRQFHRKEVHIEPGATKTLNIMLKVAPERAGCPAGTVKKGPLCINLCETDPAQSACRHRLDSVPFQDFSSRR